MTMVTRVTAVVVTALVLTFLAGMGAAPRSLAQGGKFLKELRFLPL